MRILTHRKAKQSPPDDVRPVGSKSPAEFVFKDESESSDLPSHVIELPSRGKFYPGNKSSLTITPFVCKHIYQLIGASKLKSEYEIERQVASTVNDVLLDFDAFNLTTGDYEFVLYWLRLNSFVKSPYTITWEYKQSDDSVKKVVSTIRRTDLMVVEVNSNKMVLDPTFKYATVNDKIDLLKIQEDKDEAKEYIARRASHLDGKNLDEKIAKMMRLSPDAIVDLDKHAREFDHGIQEWIEVVDPEDEEETKYRYKLELSITDFFP